MALKLTGNHLADRICGRAALGCTLVALLGIAAPAAAQNSIEPNNGGATQYIPPAPEPGGDKPANPNAPGNPSALPPSARAALPPGAEGDLLARIATSPGYGAPRSAGAGRGHGDGKSGGSGAASSRGARRAHEDGGSAVSAVASAASEPGVTVLLAGVLALSLGMVALARSRRRRGD